jgi:hypothetical protein
LFWPAEMPDRFEDLAIKIVVVVTDYPDSNEVAYDAGPHGPAVAGSMANPLCRLVFLAMGCSSTASCKSIAV